MSSVVEKECPVCDHSFTVPQWKHDRGEGKYCSRECYYEWRRQELGTPAAQRFWNHVDKTDDCWLWTGALTKNGYGHIQTQDRTPVRAHRLSYEIHFEDPGDSYVLHNCDTPWCVNPDHLFLGDQADNMQDASDKGRTHHGERTPNSTLTADEVLEMRDRYRSKDVSMSALADEYGVGSATAVDAIRGITWGHLPRSVSQEEKSRYN